MKTLISMDALVFIGKPSALFDETNPDWAPPSLRLGYSCKHAGAARHECTKKRRHEKWEAEAERRQHRLMRVDEAECGSLPMTVRMQ
ncbi:hypothetical protein HPB52_014558 [Rhipicephalus sanguineus]|uniref:Uncharacterized protein n=1 Tax=Rhipicephalus sanguineus TaxID=34632 RepID=A0A9D4Q0H3_RHISA|nr:hypothetical protein HPB52_014558 [Rhipicephalus sanguineus]